MNVKQRTGHNQLPPVFNQLKNHRFSKAKSKLLELLTEENKQDQFKQIFQEIQSCSEIQQITSILINYTKKSMAQAMAKDFFQGLQKDKITLTKIQKFYQLLRIKKISGQDINNLRKFVQSGRRMKIQQFLQKIFGIYQGQKIFKQFQSQFTVIQSKPIAGSQFIKYLNGLKIYKYPQNQIFDIDKQNSKSIMVLGQTGCGKSTFLNTLTNYLTGIEIQDSWRYFIVVEDSKNQMKSVTREINSYYIKDVRNNNCYRIIDTPGFGDTEGYDQDLKNVQKIKHYLKFQLQQIDLVLFLMKSSNTLITDFHRYIFQSVMDLFDKTIAENFVFILTFADSSQPIVLKHLQDKQQGFGRYWQAIQQPKTIKINNSGFFQKIQMEDQVEADFWKKGCQKISDLIKKAQKIKSKSLALTKKQIDKKQNLSLRIKITAQRIQNHIISQQNIRQVILKLLQNQQQMMKNQNFYMQVDQQQWYGQSVSFNVTRCNNCMNANCHLNCDFGDGVEKKQCIVIRPGRRLARRIIIKQINNQTYKLINNKLSYQNNQSINKVVVQYFLQYIN